MNKKQFIQIEEDIKTAIETADPNLLRNSLKDLKVFYGKTISTFYLRNLIEGTAKRKANKVYYVMKKADLKTYSDFKSGFKREITPYKTEVIEYYRNKSRKICSKEPRVIHSSREQNRRYIKNFDFIII